MFAAARRDRIRLVNSTQAILTRIDLSRNTLRRLERALIAAAILSSSIIGGSGRRRGLIEREFIGERSTLNALLLAIHIPAVQPHEYALSRRRSVRMVVSIRTLIRVLVRRDDALVVGLFVVFVNRVQVDHLAVCVPTTVSRSMMVIRRSDLVCRRCVVEVDAVKVLCRARNGFAQWMT